MKILSATWGEIVVESDGFCRVMKLLGYGKAPRAVAQWPFIVVKNRQEYARAWLLNHERIHFHQQRDLLILFMFLLYWGELFYARLVHGMSMKEAYFWNSAEQEAYLNQHNLEYLQTRRWGSQFRYLFDKKRFRVTDVPGELEYY